MIDQHPMTPPPELLKQWEDDWFNEREHADVLLVNAYAAGAQAGANQELDACCEWLKLEGHEYEHEALLSARRPKPLSLKEQALETLQRISKDKYPCNYQEDSDWDTIRRALEALPDG